MPHKIVKNIINTQQEFDNTYISRDKLYAKIDHGIAEYKQGKTKKLDVYE